VKSVDQVRFATRVADAKAPRPEPVRRRPVDGRERESLIQELEREMQAAAEGLDFERAAKLRDQIVLLKKRLGQSVKQDDVDSAGFAEPGQRRRGRQRSRSPRGKRVPWPDKP
jgi:hypothetical protein